MTYLAKWWLVHALHWALLYGAFAARLDGALYVLKFWVWVMAPLSLFLLTDKAAADAAKKPPRPVLGWLSMLQAWATLGLLVWFGHIASGLAWGLVMLNCAWHRDAARKARGSATEAAA
jgi:hypothetical protein